MNVCLIVEVGKGPAPQQRLTHCLSLRIQQMRTVSRGSICLDCSIMRCDGKACTDKQYARFLEVVICSAFNALSA